MQSRQDIVLSVYFSSTGTRIEDNNSITSSFVHGDAGCHLNSNVSEISNLASNYKMSFDGCSGILGFLFGTGIDEQCQEVVAQIARIREKIVESKSGKRIMVNCYGYSRGGVTALLLAKMLGHYPEDMVSVNLALLDPVPGNSIISTKLDASDITLANQVVNLSDCHNLKRVISIYHYQPSPDYFFSPVRPAYPERTLVEENIIPGTHFEIGSMSARNLATDILLYFKKFMEDCGTLYSDLFTNRCLPQPRKSKMTYGPLIKKYPDWFPADSEIVTRSCHSASLEQAEILFNKPDDNQLVFKHFDFTAKEEEIEKQSIKAPDVRELCETLQTLANDIFKNMSSASQSSEKGKLVTTFTDRLNAFPKEKCSHEETKRLATEYLRVLIQIALQRDRNVLSFFTTTTSGEAMRELLKKDQYAYFRHLIAGTTRFHDAPRYRDLRSFAGGFNPHDFNARYRDEGYSRLQNVINTIKHNNSL